MKFLEVPGNARPLHDPTSAPADSAGSQLVTEREPWKNSLQKEPKENQMGFGSLLTWCSSPGSEGPSLPLLTEHKVEKGKGKKLEWNPLKECAKLPKFSSQMVDQGS